MGRLADGIYCQIEALEEKIFNLEEEIEELKEENEELRRVLRCQKYEENQNK